MEETAKPTEPTPPKPTPMVIRKSNNAPLIGAIIFLALVIGAAAIYLGSQRNSNLAVVAPTPTPQAAGQTVPTQEVIPTNTLEENNWESHVNTKMKDLSFPAYSLSYPFEWKQTSNRDDITDTVTFTKEGNEIKIYQAPMGGSKCIFEGEVPTDFASDYTDSEFIEIVTPNITFRRIIPEKETGKVTYSFCSNNLSDKNSFTTPTAYGAISYTVNNPTPAILSEMDKIVATLKTL